MAGKNKSWYPTQVIEILKKKGKSEGKTVITKGGRKPIYQMKIII